MTIHFCREGYIEITRLHKSQKPHFWQNRPEMGTHRLNHRLNQGKTTEGLDDPLFAMKL
jgi:hypothetical protein